MHLLLYFLEKPMNILKSVTFLALVLSLAGCSTLLPRGSSQTASPWKTYEEARAAFDRIESGQTTAQQMRALGFDGGDAVNVTLLNYTDVITRFIPSPVIAREDLEAGILKCIEAKQACQVRQYDLKKLEKKRYGNFFADFFNFERKEEIKGWSFSALILLIDDRVIYKLWSGQPSILEYNQEKNPLGPLQGAGPSKVQREVIGE